MWRAGKVLLLGLFLLSSFSLVSLSEEEKAALPNLSKDSLIQIILEYDKGLTIAENALIEWKSLTTEREKDLIEREVSNEIAREQLKVQEQVFLESLQTQKEIKRQAAIDRIVTGVACFGIGIGAGVIIGGIAF